jgi:hypothetical protein
LPTEEDWTAELANGRGLDAELGKTGENWKKNHVIIISSN